MALVPQIPATTLAQAKTVWKESIAAYGREVQFQSDDESVTKTVRAFCKRPKILGLWDRTEQSYDQERYMVIVDGDDFPTGARKFARIRWNNEDHAVLSVTEVDIAGTVFGYRILVKG